MTGIVLRSAGLPCSCAPAWQSNGGVTRSHPARALPHSIEAVLPNKGEILQLKIVGVFALHADGDAEPAGTVGAMLHLMGLQGESVFRQDLLNGRHYSDGFDLRPLMEAPGDGTSRETVGQVEIEGRPNRVDVMTIDLPPGIYGGTLRFKDLGSPASFLIGDIFSVTRPEKGCPFHSRGGGVPLSELGAVVRLGDRARFNQAIMQLERSTLSSTDLDEARGQALVFLAVVSAATLELGGGREAHRLQLDAARALENCQSGEDLFSTAMHFIEAATEAKFAASDSPTTRLVDKALALVERNFARPITDATVAAQLGLSTSHFRFLFRQATGQPFHKYLIAYRLERARAILMEQSMPVGLVAQTVGFAGISHFSRAFSQKFHVSPTSVRRTSGDS